MNKIMTANNEAAAIQAAINDLEADLEFLDSYVEGLNARIGCLECELDDSPLAEGTADLYLHILATKSDAW